MMGHAGRAASARVVQLHPPGPAELQDEGTLVLPLMYPHALDRYRVLQLIVRQLRDQFRLPGQEVPGVGQKLIALRARVGQPTVSNLENLQESLHSPKRHVGREELVKVLAWGLELDQLRIDALLWLYDGHTLSAGEVRAYLRGYLPQAVPARYCAEELRAAVLAELDRYVALREQGPERHLSDVRLFSANEDKRADILAAAITQDSVPGQRLLVKTSLTLNLLRDETGTPLHDWRANVGNGNGRRSTTRFQRAVTTYGERSIHPVSAIVRYLDPHINHPLSLQTRQQHVANLISLMKAAPAYEVGFADNTPTLEFICRGLTSAVILSAVKKSWDWPHSDWGPAAIEFWDTKSVLWFSLLFERQWDALPPDRRDRRYVIPWLESQLQASLALSGD
ncbi:MAG: hypothetical protein ACM3S1_07410 [Hyphomicrobiales bacterium]